MIDELKANLESKDAKLQLLEIRLREKDRQAEVLESRLNRLESIVAEALAKTDKISTQQTTLTNPNLLKNQADQ